jgi:RecJ-like exonuclease
MTRGTAVRIDGTGEEGHVVDTRRTGDIVVDTGTYDVLLGPDAVTPIWGSGQLQVCPACGGRGTTDGVSVCDRCGGTCTVVARPRGTDKDMARA